ncbi:mannose-6-phosphate isomerase, class I [Occultella kanbiaonis]|uniref:mannose-6-phosphate isomerase, class I n=1 Tax=Occultella kanbiaonis TaxID=2675754 RepID=UPI0013D302B0|nr:mannose-6-phosphate isomerase, class I [Occultella kanbiaonis]
MHLLTNPLLRYRWGSGDLLQRLLGVPTDGHPLAEVRIGAHGEESSQLIEGGHAVRLDRFVAAHPAATLGDAATRDGSRRLPFEARLLATRAPLPLQVCPDATQARVGHAREEAAGVDAYAPQRLYPDDSARPGLIHAFSGVQMLAGFRPVPAIHASLAGWDLSILAPIVSALTQAGPGDELLYALTTLLASSATKQRQIAEGLARAARERPEHPDAGLVTLLAEHHPGDVGVVLALLLNQVRMEPGEVRYLPPGMIHGYLSGMGLELTASSGNVVRAGLSLEHVDLRQVLRIAGLTVGEPPRLEAVPDGVATVFASPAGDLGLWASPGAPGPVPGPAHGPRLVVCLHRWAPEADAGPGGRATVSLTTDAGGMTLSTGQSAFVSDADGPLRVRSSGPVLVAHLPQVR